MPKERQTIIFEITRKQAHHELHVFSRKSPTEYAILILSEDFLNIHGSQNYYRRFVLIIYSCLGRRNDMGYVKEQVSLAFNFLQSECLLHR